jgi:predicted nucleotide-binding protein
MARKKFTVVIMHGSADHYEQVKTCINTMGFTSIVLKEFYTGEFLLKKVKKAVWKYAHCAVIVMSPDDLVGNSEPRARQNVVFELGYCMGAFDSIPKKYWYNSVIILKEKSVAKFSDIDGLEVIEYEKEPTTADLKKLAGVLETTYKNASEYYDEL